MTLSGVDQSAKGNGLFDKRCEILLSRKIWSFNQGSGGTILEVNVYLILCLRIVPGVPGGTGTRPVGEGEEHCKRRSKSQVRATCMKEHQRRREREKVKGFEQQGWGP